MTAKRSRKRVASVREYIASKPKESRASLEAVRRAILKALPNAQEGPAYQMPAYTLNGVGVLYFAGWQSHYSLYPASDALVEAFAKELAPIRTPAPVALPWSQRGNHRQRLNHVRHTVIARHAEDVRISSRHGRHSTPG